MRRVNKVLPPGGVNNSSASKSSATTSVATTASAVLPKGAGTEDCPIDLTTPAATPSIETSPSATPAKVSTANATMPAPKTVPAPSSSSATVTATPARTSAPSVSIQLKTVETSPNSMIQVNSLIVEKWFWKCIKIVFILHLTFLFYRISWLATQHCACWLLQWTRLCWASRPPRSLTTSRRKRRRLMEVSRSRTTSRLRSRLRWLPRRRHRRSRQTTQHRTSWTPCSRPWPALRCKRSLVNLFSFVFRETYILNKSTVEAA